MPSHENNAQNTRTIETAETGESDSRGIGGGRRLGGIGRTGALALTTVGGRRFILTMVSGAGTWLLCWCGKIDGGVYSVVTIATVAAFIAGNTAQKMQSPAAE